MYRTEVLTTPASAPVSLEEAKLFLRITSTAEDALISAYIEAATSQLETYTRRTFVTTEFRGEYDAVQVSGQEAHPFVTLYRSPVASIESVQVSNNGVYYDADYQLKLQSGFSRVLLGDSETSVLDSSPFPLRVDYTAGYGGPDDVPQAIKTAILMYVNHLYSNRGDCTPECNAGMMPNEIKALLGPYRIIQTFAA
jgi:uncharacterized phiE125 gp8 family phage protein